MDGRNLFAFFAYHTEKKGVIMNSVVLEDFPLDRLATAACMDVLKARLIEVCEAAELAAPTSINGLPPVPEKVKNVVVMDWRWMDRPATVKANGRKRDIRV